MRYFFPLKNDKTNTYSKKIKDYRSLTANDKKILVNDIKEFVKYCFWWLNLPCPTRDQLYIAVFIKNGVKDKEPSMLQAQRGLGKSLITQIVCMWLLRRNRDEKIVVVSATSSRSESFVNFCFQLIVRIPLLNDLEPKGRDRASTKKLDVAGRTPDDSPSLCAFGVFSAKTGSRATIIIYDDVEIPENSDTAQKREKILAGVRDTANLGISNAFTETCICTPQSSESVYIPLKDEDGFRRTIIPAEYPEDPSVYEGDLAKHIARDMRVNPDRVGSPTDARQDARHLAKQKMKGKARFKLHYMLDTQLSDEEKFPLKLRDLIVMDLEKDKAPLHVAYSSDRKDALWEIKHKGFKGDSLFGPKFASYDNLVKYQGVAMFVDPSGRGTDETAYCVTAQLNGRIFLLDFGGIQGGYGDDALETLAYIAKEYSVHCIEVESNFGDGSFAELLKPIVSRIYRTAYRGSYDKQNSGVAISDNRATTRKETRIIETLEPVVMQHKLIVNKSAIIRDSEKESMYSFTYQYTHIQDIKGALKHDDIIDVVEMGVSYWQESLARDSDLEARRLEIKQKEDMLKELDAKRKKRRSAFAPRQNSFDSFKRRA